jgi:hypothetical protein
VNLQQVRKEDFGWEEEGGGEGNEEEGSLLGSGRGGGTISARRAKRRRETPICGKRVEFSPGHILLLEGKGE